MTIIKKTKTTLLVGCFLFSSLTLTGCQTASFKKPNFEKLAFWKKDGALAGNKVPPPPARHFDPSPIQRGKLAKEEFEDTELMELGGRRFNEDFAASSMATDTNAVPRQQAPKQSPRDSLAFEITQKSSATPEATPSSDSQFEFSPKQSLTTEQQDFNSAMQNVSVGNKLPADNSFKANSTTPSNPESWNQFTPPSGLANKGANSVDKSLKGISNAIGEANGKLAASKSKLLSPNLGFTPPPNPQTPATSWNTQTSNGFQSPVGFKAPSGFQNQKGVSLSTNSNPAKPEAFGSAPPPLGSVQAQVADAKLQIELLKQQVANAEQMANQTTKAATQTQNPMEPQALTPLGTSQDSKFGNNNISNRFDSNYAAPEAKKIASGKGFAPSNKANPASGTGYGTQPFIPTPKSNIAPPSYPSTPHGDYSSRNSVSSNFSPAGLSDSKSQPFEPPQSASQVDFQDKTKGDAIHQANSPIANSEGASKIQTHVSDVFIPASILTGKGSYAPGSVHPVSEK